MSTLRVEYVKVGDRLVPVAVPNDIIPAETFYVSYNDVDLDLFGGATTALVLGQMSKFYILMGDHRQQYAPLIEQGFEACLDYYKANLELAHKHSDVV